jgi:hypothetical protein
VPKVNWNFSKPLIPEDEGDISNKPGLCAWKWSETNYGPFQTHVQKADMPLAATRQRRAEFTSSAKNVPEFVAGNATLQTQRSRWNLGERTRSHDGTNVAHNKYQYRFHIIETANTMISCS